MDSSEMNLNRYQRPWGMLPSSPDSYLSRYMQKSSYGILTLEARYPMLTSISDRISLIPRESA